MSTSTAGGQQARKEQLDSVAKVLTGAFVAVSGLFATLGLTSDFMIAALNNHPGLMRAAGACATAAVTISLTALLLPPDWPKAEIGILVTGVVAYMVALILAVLAATWAAGGNGRPTISEIKVENQSASTKLGFAVRADGVKVRSTIAAYVHAVGLKEGQSKDTATPRKELMYQSSLRSDDKGDVEQRITTSFPIPEWASGIDVYVSSSEGLGKTCGSPGNMAPACLRLWLK
ncbi:hypothetical protein [Streptomyces caelestis]|uniref:hypothetical protein n=1 Tax=Streptomyces caelestis TaxID=36816 RepID=UPI0036FCA5EF